jgi:hypothetical protein
VPCATARCRSHDADHLALKSRSGRTTAVLHRTRAISEAELANQFATVDSLLANEDVARFLRAHEIFSGRRAPRQVFSLLLPRNDGHRLFWLQRSA